MENMVVEFIAIPDDSEESESRSERLDDLVAKVILLGHKRRGRPRKETTYEEEIAA